MSQSATLDAPSLSHAAPGDGVEPYSLHVASGRDWEREIDDLRIASYRSAGYFKLPDPDTVRRRTDPDDSLCLLLRQGPVLAATVRLAYVRDRAAAEAVLQGPVPLDTDDFPSVSLCRGATAPRHRGRDRAPSRAAQRDRHAGRRHAALPRDDPRRMAQPRRRDALRAQRVVRDADDEAGAPASGGDAAEHRALGPSTRADARAVEGRARDRTVGCAAGPHGEALIAASRGTLFRAMLDPRTARRLHHASRDACDA
jgi:hypothetical protein